MATDLEFGSLPITFSKLDGGLNTASGALNVQDNEATDIQNVDLDKFGSIIERNGYTTLNTTPIPTGTSQGLYWYTSLYDRNLITVNSGKIYKMDSLDGVWDDVTGAVSFATGILDTYTKLLLNFDGSDGGTSFIDSSQSGHLVTTTGTGITVQTTTAQYKFGTASGSFTSASLTYLSIASHQDWNFGTGDFSIDSWARLTNVAQEHVLYGQRVDGSNNIVLYYHTAGRLYFSVNGGGVADYYCSWSPTANTWYHTALVRSSTNLFMFIDGISQTLTVNQAIGSNSMPDLATDIRIGNHGNSYMDGWIDSFRVSKGIARWVANFTPPTEAYGDYLQQDFETFLGDSLGTDSENTPWRWTVNNSTATNMTVPTGVTGAKFIKKFQNYCILANVKISGVRYPSRFYWSAIRSISSWDAADWIEVSKDDGDEITGVKVLGDRLVIYKNNSIYVALFTGDSNIPFILQKTNSSVGCASHWTIQEVDNGHIFLSYDGIYYFDGSSSVKLSQKINPTIINGLNRRYLDKSVSLYQKRKNNYMLSTHSSSSLYQNIVLSYNTYLGAWSVYSGISASAMAIAMNEGNDERPYFADNLGYVYRMDTGFDDFPTNTRTAINCYYYTNWKHYNDICDRKGIPHIYITHSNETSTNLTFAYSYDFFNGDQYTSSFSLLAAQSVTALTTRRDLIGRGRFARFKFANNATTTSFRIDGIGTYITKESKS